MPQVREADGYSSCSRPTIGSKDQSYFLHRLKQAQLSRAMFPLGDILKSEVRAIAEQHGLPIMQRRTAPASASSANARSANS